MELVNVLEGVCFVMGQDLERVKKRDRYRELVICRHLFYYLAKYFYGAKLKQIGAVTGVDHATVIHGIKLVNNLIDIGDEDVINAIEETQKYIREKYQGDKKISVYVPYDVNLTTFSEMLTKIYKCRVILSPKA
jgi:Bacterial dnaA protein helix-turn-helix